MKITLDIPEPKVQQGAILTDGYCIFHVDAVQCAGTWSLRDTERPRVDFDRFDYVCVVQEGSVQRGKAPHESYVRKPVRPGSIIFLSDADIVDLQPVPDFDRSKIVTQDTIDNIDERDAAWTARLLSDQHAQALAALTAGQFDPLLRGSRDEAITALVAGRYDAVFLFRGSRKED